tara:strand:- start:8438 stop:8734 length:297 start_codon:yes stop_codon:yes gene_type:complete
MVIAKAMVLNREESSEIDAYNKLLKQYHEAVFFDMTEKSVTADKAKGYDDLMKSFRNHFGKETIKAEKTSKSLKDDFTDISLKSLGEQIKKRKTEGKK